MHDRSVNQKVRKTEATVWRRKGERRKEKKRKEEREERGLVYDVGVKEGGVLGNVPVQ